MYKKLEVFGLTTMKSDQIAFDYPQVKSNQLEFNDHTTTVLLHLGLEVTYIARLTVH